MWTRSVQDSGRSPCDQEVWDAETRGVSIFWWSFPVVSLILGPRALTSGRTLP